MLSPPCAAELRLQRQLEYYFSNKNLWRDQWLANQLRGCEISDEKGVVIGSSDCTGWIDVEVIAGFKRVRQITNCVEVVAKVLSRIESLEVRDENADGDGPLTPCSISTPRAADGRVCLFGPTTSTPAAATTSGIVTPAGIKNTESGVKKYQVRRREPLPPKPVVTAVCTQDDSSSEDPELLQQSSTTAMDGTARLRAMRRKTKSDFSTNMAGSGEPKNKSQRSKNGGGNHNDNKHSNDHNEGEEPSSCMSRGSSHQSLRSLGRSPYAFSDGTESTDGTSDDGIPGFRQVPKTGVIYVMDEAAKLGYCSATAHEWANLGQGSPETTDPKSWPTNVRHKIQDMVAKGKLSSESGPFADLTSLEVNSENLHYGNVNGDLALRNAVAKFYNDMYRKGHPSQYTAENVALVGGGRLALTRLCTAMDDINLGHFLPDYTAYTELLSNCKHVQCIPIPLNPEDNFKITPKELKREIVGKGLSALLLSNPCNPTGQITEGEDLKNWVRLARETRCSFVMDEIYSRYVYTQRMAPSDASWRMVSAAQFVEDVNSDPIVILDGLTKNWRMPGLRVCWIVGPAQVIEAVGAAGSYLDGGPSLPTQRALVPLLDPKAVIEQTIMLQQLFSHKRDFLLKRLADMGMVVEHPPQGTFYCWCDLSDLPKPLNDCWGFFRCMLAEAKVICCPGVFFDVNPGQRRKFRQYDSFVRLSYGPGFKELKRGLDNMERVILKYRAEEARR